MRVPILLVLVLPAMTIYYAGQNRIKQAAEKLSPKGPSREEQVARVEQEREVLLQSSVGKEGTTVSRLSRYGKIETGDNIFEARTKKGFLAKGLKIRVLAYDSDGLIVEKI